MIVKPYNPIGKQYTNQIELDRFESVWIEHNGLTVHVYAGLRGIQADIFTQPMQTSVGPVDSAEADYPKGIA